MGNKPEKAERFRKVTFKRTNLVDVNDFCSEITSYNLKINKIRDAMEVSEKNLILYLGLADIETLIGKSYKITMKDVTMAIFYAFSGYFKGDFLKMTDMQF